MKACFNFTVNSTRSHKVR